jgi:hypothetical protein
MRHTHGVTSTPPPQSAGPHRDTPTAAAAKGSRTSVGQVFAAVAGFLALAAIGAAIGWGVTPAPHPTAGGPSTSPSVSRPPSSPPPSSPSPPPSSQSNGLFTIPDYHAEGVTFQEARDQLRRNRIGVTLFFDDSGPVGTTVRSTTPGPGTQIAPGHTVNVYVDGTAPPLSVPALPGSPTTCNSWGKTLADLGFRPQYSGARNLLVAAEDPTPDTPGTHWNQTVTLTCTDTGQPPSAPPSSPPPSAPPDDSTPSP